MTINEYRRELVALTRSLIIRFSGEAYMVECWYSNLVGKQVGSDIRSFLYYRDICGIYTPDAGDVYFKPISMVDSAERVLLTRDNLAIHTDVRNELKLYGGLFQRMIDENPLRTNYIKGCLANISIDDAISSENGTILSYETSFVNVREVNLISELESYVKSYLKQQYNIGYMLIDNLYIASVLAVLYSTIPQQIDNIRKKNINTTKVSDFYMELFFRSRLNIWSDIIGIDEQSIIWLYLNLDRLIKHTGREDTLKKIAINILKPNNISLRNAVYKELLTKSTNTGLGVPITSYGTGLLISSPMYDVGYTTDKVAVNDILVYEAGKDLTDTEIGFVQNVVNEKLVLKPERSNIIKTLLVSDNPKLQIGYNAVLQSALSRLFTVVFGGLSLDKTERVYSVRVSDVTSTCTLDTAVAVLLKRLFYITGIDYSLIESLSWIDLYRTSIDFDKYLLDYSQNTGFNDMYNSMLTYDELKNGTDLRKIMADSVCTSVSMWKLSCAVNNNLFISELESIRRDMEIKYSIKVSLADYLRNNITSFELNEIFTEKKKVLIDFIELFNSLTSIDLRGIDDDSTLLTGLCNVLTKLVSYTSQVIKKPVDHGGYPMHNYEINPVKLVSPLAAVIKASSPEPVNICSVNISAVGDNDLLKIFSQYEPSYPIIRDIGSPGTIIAGGVNCNGTVNVATVEHYRPICYVEVN
jgi:hypothetical protein